MPHHPPPNADRAAEEPALREYFRVLGRRRKAVVVFVLLVTATAVGSSLVQSKRYSAEAQVLIQPRQSSEELAGANAPVVLDKKRVIDTEVRVMSSESVRERVEATFGPATPAATVAPVEGTDLVSVRVTSTDPALAQAVANATVAEYTEFRRETQTADLLAGVRSVQAKVDALAAEIDAREQELATVAGAQAATLETQQDTARARYAVLQQQAETLSLSASLSTGDANLVDPAGLPTDPSSPQPLRALILGLLAGGVLGVGLAFLIDLVDDRIESKDDVERLVPRAPVVGLVPFFDQWRSPTSTPVASIEEPEGPVAQAYRSMRTSLQFIAGERDVTSIQVTSALPGEGKTATAVNLAIMFALAGADVVLVDADLRKPRVHEFFDLPNREGLSSGLLKEARLDRLLHTIEEVPGLYVITAGPTPAFPAELMQSERTRLLSEGLMKEADIVIFDSPPVLPVADPLALSSKVDAVLLVTSVSGTTRRQLSRASELLDQVGANVIGTVVNKVPAAEGIGYGTYAGYTAGVRRGRVERFFRPAGA